ncbi:MAG: xanthine dehydrogenase family protein subunit M [Hyphomicrobiaceae bacterium]|nr:xanthine dehydrogenase family protein subunit M [Hyphomicrobiaceae bacterium]
MYDFTYHRPETLADAEKMFADADDGQYIAGGQTMVPVMKQRLAMPSDIIDLERISDLKGISRDGNVLSIGAMTTHAEVAGSGDVAKAIPALARLADDIGDPAVRNRGTLGGSIANNDPAADYPAALVGLGATIHTTSREIPADDFFTGLFETALEEGEVIVKVSIPVPDKAGYVKFPQPASRFALVGVFVAQIGDSVRVAATGAGPCVFRVEAMEKALEKDFSASALKGISVPGEGLNNDIHASADYRASLISTLARRAVAAAE